MLCFPAFIAGPTKRNAGATRTVFRSIGVEQIILIGQLCSTPDSGCADLRKIADGCREDANEAGKHLLTRLGLRKVGNFVAKSLESEPLYQHV